MGEKEAVIIKKNFKLIGKTRFVRWNDNLDMIVEESKIHLDHKINTIKNVRDTNVRIKYFYSETGSREGFYYMEAVEVSNLDYIPDGLSAKELPESLYAVFKEKHGEEGIAGEYARKEWLPESGFEENHVICGDLEISFEDNHDIHEFWLPIK